ncbi:uncharacterized protein MONOS_10148 [Monocercomonoides exilis]|uniref:uncharacterized protein n=1 Tax=Monocercomonoides exilis TaxID=2049356 RepID=UPI0035596283|nr:hypothetical protein MONOS_10148 [Monocercomonoides exilis]|eukprot:MONOS_10148.1-p1 / transcript=MONOS_10148.1 / gene=MONOS_10148 / organism=Monocercomonoides_exilis_PA203 / gene_product=unspecified product / transcript_product=unspecified product / location=Mono_scaffold00449:7551-7799(+) / protein_length=83 / sequence_SO=supercontig / SO=protein_coding / is_pseudo=false
MDFGSSCVFRANQVRHALMMQPSKFAIYNFVVCAPSIRYGSYGEEEEEEEKEKEREKEKKDEEKEKRRKRKRRKTKEKLKKD